MKRTRQISAGRFTVAAASFLTLCGSAIGFADEGTTIRFTKHQLDEKFRSEGVAVGDFNNNGKLDIAAGFVWYEAPDWNMHVISSEPPSGGGALIGEPPHYNPSGYSNSFCNFAYDVNGNGWTDLIVVDFPGTATWWFENPQGEDREWDKHLLTPVTNNESPAFLDLTGDGRPELIAGFSPDPEQPDGPDRQMAFLTPADDVYAPWNIHPISTKEAPGSRRYSHGLGVGDINGNGRLDVVTYGGWWEAPEDRFSGPWTFHEVPFGEAAQIHVYDFNGSGRSDVLTSSPHAYGIWWHEQHEDGSWQKHEIDSSFSQTHAVAMADINGNGLMDFVTGKRWWAHGGRDPGADEPAVFFWFELQQENGQARWIRHHFDHDSGPGTQFEVIDVNGDGLLDVVSSNKKGVFYFQQRRE